jgi:uncharacterized alkaline shock family protein YloU
MIDVARTALGRIAVERKALAKVVQATVESVDRARTALPRRTLLVEVAEDGAARVELALSAPHGAVLPELARRVQDRVAEVLRATLGTSDVRVDVTVDGIHPDGGR